MAKRKRKQKCENCQECIYVGEGSFICAAGYQKIVIEDFMPTDDYFHCQGKSYIREE